MSRPLTLTAVCSLLLLTSAAVMADSPKETGNDAGPVASAKISLESAVAIAEKHANGKAVRAEYEKQKDGSWIYDVEVKADNGVTDIKVDADKGTVVASTNDPKDSDEDDDENEVD